MLEAVAELKNGRHSARSRSSPFFCGCWTSQHDAYGDWIPVFEGMTTFYVSSATAKLLRGKE